MEMTSNYSDGVATGCFLCVVLMAFILIGILIYKENNTSIYTIKMEINTIYGAEERLLFYHKEKQRDERYQELVYEFNNFPDVIITKDSHKEGLIYWTTKVDFKILDYEKN